MKLLTQSLIKEIERETSGTRRIFKRIPEEKFDWQPHIKSMTLKTLANHIVSLSQWPGIIATTHYLDIAENPLKPKEIKNTEDLLAALEDAVRHSINGLQSVSDEDLRVNWILKRGDLVIISMPREEAIRTAGLNHMYHHRGQLSVYLRLLDIPVPGIYGPSFDDKHQLK